MLIQAPQVKYARYADGAIAGVAAACAAAFASTELINYVAPLQDPLLTHLKFWSHGALKLMTHYETESWRMYSQYLDQAAHSSTPYIIKWRMCSVGLSTAAASISAGWWAGKPISDMTKVSGNDLLRDREAIKYFNSLSEKDGLKLGNGLHLDLNKETEHIAIFGGTGAGKSVSALSILVPAMKRGDRLILINYKGLTEKMPCRLFGEVEKGTHDAIILCPFDKRSVAWAVWLDVTTKTQAREFAARVIPENSKDPVWSNSGRFVLTGILLFLINNYTKKGEAWSWKMLGDLCVADRETLVEILAEHYPEGLRAIKEEGKTSECVLMNFGAFAAPIIDLADAWGDRKTGFSVESWVNNPNSKIRIVILQISSEFRVLSQAFNQSILNQVGTYLTRLPDVSADKYQLWIYADEFPRVGAGGKNSGGGIFEEMFSVGRSKSMRIMISAQSLGQLKNEYGLDISEGWIDSIGTKIMGRQDGVGAKWVSEMCGEAIYTQLHDGRTEHTGKRRIAHSAPQSFAVFPPQAAQNELGIVKQNWLAKLLKLKPAGVRMLIHGTRGADLIVNFPFPTLPKLREETILASCFKGGFGYAETVDIDTLMQAAEKEVEIVVTNSTPALLFDELQSAEEPITESTEAQPISEIEVSAIAQTMFLAEHKLETDQVDNELLEELGKEAAGDVLDNLTDSHMSVVLEVVDFIGEIQKEKEPIENLTVTNDAQKKKRYVSRKALRELQC